MASPLPTHISNNSPLYQQVALRLRQDILHGVHPAEQALPSERALMAELGISRVTARKALDVLVSQGDVERRHGSGTYVLPQLQQKLDQLASFSQTHHPSDDLPTSKWLSRTTRAATPVELGQLALQKGSQVVCLKRLRLAQSTPVALETSVLPSFVLPNPQAVSRSLYAFLKGTAFEPARATQQLSAINASAADAKLLEVETGGALLLVKRTTLSRAGTPVEYTLSKCRSDVYEFIVETKETP